MIHSFNMILGLLFLISTMQGCLRYVPSRAELQESSSETIASEIGGPEEFLSYEAELEKQLAEFVSRRNTRLPADAPTGYRLGAGDVVKLDVFGLPELATETEVTGEGDLILPYVDSVNVDNLTLSEARKKLVQAYKQFVRTPRLRLDIVTYGSSTVAVMGSVVKPGLYPLKNSNQNITDVLSMAGGRTDKAGTRIIILPAERNTVKNANTRAALSRSDEKTNQIELLKSGYSVLDPKNETPINSASESGGVVLDIDQLIGGLKTRPLKISLVSGDTIIVPEAGTVKVAGEVNKPGNFPLTSHTSTLGAIAAAGGLTYSANVHEVEIIRSIGDGKKASLILDVESVARSGTGDLDLRDSDIIRVPSEPGLFRTRQAVQFLNGFFRAGVNGTMN